MPTRPRRTGRKGAPAPRSARDRPPRLLTTPPPSEFACSAARVTAWRNADPPEANGPERGASTPIRKGSSVPAVDHPPGNSTSRAAMAKTIPGRRAATRRRIGFDLPAKGYHKDGAGKTGPGGKERKEKGRR